MTSVIESFSYCLEKYPEVKDWLQTSVGRRNTSRKIVRAIQAYIRDKNIFAPDNIHRWTALGQHDDRDEYPSNLYSWFKTPEDKRLKLMTFLESQRDYITMVLHWSDLNEFEVELRTAWYRYLLTVERSENDDKSV